MRYLLDSNIFIESHKRYYNMAVFPCFWDKLVSLAQQGLVFTIDKVKDEVYAGKDDVKNWLKNHFPNKAILSTDGISLASYQKIQTDVRNTGQYKQSALNHYAADTLADPFICAYALAHGNITVVSYETSKPASKTEIKIPDVCRLESIPCIQVYDMLLDLKVCVCASNTGDANSGSEPSLF